MKYKIWSTSLNFLVTSDLKCFQLYRFGGLTYGEQNELSQSNTTELAEFLEYVIRFLDINLNSDLTSSTTSQPKVALNPMQEQRRRELSVLELKSEIDLLISRIVTKDNAKVADTVLCSYLTSTRVFII